MKNLFIILGILFLLISNLNFVSAVDFTPQGNINLQNFYNMTNLNYFQTFKMLGKIIMRSFGTSYDITDVNYINATTINVTTLEVKNIAIDNKTRPYCGNLTGATSNLCTLTDTATNESYVLKGSSNSTILNCNNLTGNTLCNNFTSSALSQGNQTYLSTGSQNQTVLWCANLTGNTLCANFTLNSLLQTNNSNIFSLLSENIILWNEAKNKYNRTYESAANNGTVNQTSNALFQGNSTYVLINSQNGTVLYCSNITGYPICGNQTLGALIQGNLTYWLASAGTYNVSYDKLFINSSINWTDRTMIIANISFRLISDGILNNSYRTVDNFTGIITIDTFQANQSASVTNFTNLNITGTVNASRLNGLLNFSHIINIPNIYLDNWYNHTLAILNMNIFALLSENSTLWTEAKNKYNVSYASPFNQNKTILTYLNITGFIFDKTNNSYLQDNNASIVLGGQGNRTGSYCGNISGATSNLCTLIDTGGVDTFAVNYSISRINITVNDSDLIDGKHYDDNWNSTTNNTQYSEALNKYNVSYASPYNQNKSTLSYLNITGAIGIGRNQTADAITEISLSKNRTTLHILNITGLITGLYNRNFTTDTFTEIGAVRGRNRTILDILNITGLTAGLYNRNFSTDVFNELGKVGGQNRTVLSYLNITGTIGINRNQTFDAITEMSLSANRTKVHTDNVTGITWANVVTSVLQTNMIASISNNVLTVTMKNYFDQHLNTTSSPTLAGLTITGLSGIIKATTGVLGNAVAGTDYLVTDTFQANSTTNTKLANLNVSGYVNVTGNIYAAKINASRIDIEVTANPDCLTMKSAVLYNGSCRFFCGGKTSNFTVC